jgi:oxygen-dependent protoporphyrinogen oxidase
MTQNKKIAIIGGGIAGLAAAYKIQEEIVSNGTPIDCYVLEGGDSFGGKIRTDRFDGFVVERGPDSFISQKPWAIDLCKRLGLEDRLVGTKTENAKTFVYVGKKMQTLPEGLSLLVPTKFLPFATTALFSWFGKIRMGMDLIIPKKKDEEDESLASFVRRRLGNEALKRMAQPMLAGIYGSDPEKMSIKSTFPMFFQTEQKYRSLILGMLVKKREMMKAPKRESSRPAFSMFMTLKSGLGEMVEAILEKSPHINFKPKVKIRTVSFKDGNGLPKWTVVPEKGEPLTFDAIIMAPPANISANLLSQCAPELSELLHRIPYVSTAAITLAYRKDGFSHPLKGFGFLVPKSEGFHISACTWTSSKYPERAPDGFVLLRCYLGGALNEELAERDPEALASLVQEDLRAIMGITEKPVFCRVYVNRKANVQYLVGHQKLVESINEKVEDLPGLYLSGSAYTGIGIPDCINNGNVAAGSALKFLFPKTK